jgi:hypothetical protein
MQEHVTYEDIEFKDYKKANRMLRSESARQRRKEVKSVRETKIMNEWARSRRARKADKK